MFCIAESRRISLESENGFGELFGDLLGTFRGPFGLIVGLELVPAVNKPNTRYYPSPNLDQARELFDRHNRAQKNAYSKLKIVGSALVTKKLALLFPGT